MKTAEVVSSPMDAQAEDPGCKVLGLLREETALRADDFPMGGMQHDCDAVGKLRALESNSAGFGPHISSVNLAGLVKLAQFI